jgi:hypothetical protein
MKKKGRVLLRADVQVASFLASHISGYLHIGTVVLNSKVHSESQSLKKAYDYYLKCITPTFKLGASMNSKLAKAKYNKPLLPGLKAGVINETTPLFKINS